MVSGWCGRPITKTRTFSLVRKGKFRHLFRMNAPLSRISLLLAVLLFVAALFQKQIANAVGNPLTEPTQLEQVMSGIKGATGQSALIEVPKHPVSATIFWIAVVIAALALWAWIVEDNFWLPLVAMCIALAAAMLKMAILPAVIAAARAGGTQVKRRRASSTSRSRSSTGSSSTTQRRRSSSSKSLDS